MLLANRCLTLFVILMFVCVHFTEWLQQGELSRRGSLQFQPSLFHYAVLCIESAPPCMVSKAAEPASQPPPILSETHLLTLRGLCVGGEQSCVALVLHHFHTVTRVTSHLAGMTRADPNHTACVVLVI